MRYVFNVTAPVGGSKQCLSADQHKKIRSADCRFNCDSGINSTEYRTMHQAETNFCINLDVGH